MNDWKEQFHCFNSRFLERNENVFIAGCPCHVAHIAASNPHDAFSEYIALKDTHREKTPSNKTPGLRKSTNMGVWAVGTLNQLFIRGSLTFKKIK